MQYICNIFAFHHTKHITYIYFKYIRSNSLFYRTIQSDIKKLLIFFEVAKRVYMNNTYMEIYTNHIII